MTQEQLVALLRALGQIVAGIVSWSWWEGDTIVSLLAASALFALIVWMLWSYRKVGLIQSAAALEEVSAIEVTDPEIARATHMSIVRPPRRL